MALLTDRTLAASSAITASTLIHIVDVNDFSQNPAGSSYKANLGQLSSFFSGSTFTGGSGNCITDFYVTNIHGCSPIHIQPTSPDDVYLVEGGGNVGIGLTSASTKLHVSGTTIINSDNMMLSDTLTTIPTLPNFKGVIVSHDYSSNNGIVSSNTNPSGNTAIFFRNDSLVTGQMGVGGSQSVRTGSPVDGVNFYRNKIVLRGNSSSDGMIFNPNSGNLAGTFWWEFAGISGMILKGNGGDRAYLGLALNPDGTEMPTYNLQIGGTGTTGTFQYKDGNQSNGYLLTSDSNGYATWEPFASSAFTGNTSATCITDLHVSNIHSCSPLYINPLSEGDIYVGSANTLTVDLTNERIGIGTNFPTEKLHVSGNTIINGNLSVTGNAILSATTASTLNISSTPTTDTGTTANYLTRDGSTGEVKVKTIPGPTVYGLFAQTGNSATVSATTVETTIIGPGKGGLIVPPNTFQIGDSFQASMDGDITCINTATIHVHVRTTGGVVLIDTGVIDLDTATNRHWFLNLFFTIRQIGGTTVASISSGGIFSYVRDTGQTYEGFPLSQVNNTTFDTTILNTLDVTVTWNTNDSGNRIFSRNLTLTKIF